jgi:hypothetical protein
MFKRTKLIAGIALLVQAVTCLVFFFIYLGKKKKAANTFLGVGVLAAIAGAFMLIWEKEEENLSLLGDDWDDCEDLFDDYRVDDIDCVISDGEEDSTADVVTFDTAEEV